MESKQERDGIYHHRTSITGGSQSLSKLSCKVLYVGIEKILEIMKTPSSQQWDWLGQEDLPEKLSLSFITSASYENIGLFSYL